MLAMRVESFRKGGKNGIHEIVPLHAMRHLPSGLLLMNIF